MTALVLHAGDALINPSSGEVVDLAEPGQVAEWLDAVRNLEREVVQPAKRVAFDAIYDAMDADGTYTLRTENGFEVKGQSRRAWEDQERTDTATLYADLVALRMQQAKSSRVDAMEWALGFFKQELTLTASGRDRLSRMSGEHAELLAAHTVRVDEADRRARQAPTVRRTA